MSSQCETVFSEELTTDAMPSPPRIPTNVKNTTTDTEYKSENHENIDNNYAYRKPKARGLPKPKAPKSAKSACYVNICNSTNVQVGDNNIINFGNNENSQRRKSQIVETEEIKKLYSNKSLVNLADFRFLSGHIGKGWRDIFRILDFSDGQIEQFEEMYHISGLKEVIYQLLRDWKENTAEKATVSVLSEALWNSNEKDALQRWSLKYPVS